MASLCPICALKIRNNVSTQVGEVGAVFESVISMRISDFRAKR